ncbi:MAG: hypothetical protein KKG60_03945 [Nanoarchaeota archaeon]|nr:hypothetical protein [Nanoarchaeota archaeon]
MKCYKCNGKMESVKGIRFNNYKIDGWKCGSCGEAYLNPEQAERILTLNKMKKQRFRLKLNQVRSNLILRIPKQVSTALGLKNGESVEFGLKTDNEMFIHPLKGNLKP